ncbi:MAG: hypothetical protein SFV54_03395 [Bryobacteraceae bacterium]|nr:hypothetical protein [Bryobacteraceae bacterium]
MKRTAVLLTATLGLFFSTSLAKADTQVKANIPFAFEVDGRQMPAGDYVFQINKGRIPAIAFWTPETRTSNFIMQTLPQERENCTCLKFYTFAGNRKVLAEVNMKGAVGRVLVSAESAKRKSKDAPPQVAMLPLVAAE